MIIDRKDKRKSVRLPSAGGGFTGRSAELKGIRDAFIEQGSVAVVIYGPPGSGKTALSVRTLESMPEEFEYAYSFDCRGGLRVEEFMYRMFQFMGYHGKGDFQNILLSPIPLELKLEFLVKLLKRMKILLIFDEVDDMLEPEHGRLVFRDRAFRDTVSSLMKECAEGARFIFTCSSRFSPPVAEHISYTDLSVDGPEEAHFYSRLRAWLGDSGADMGGLSAEALLDRAMERLPQAASKALVQCAAYEKAVTFAGFAASGEDAGLLVEAGLLGTYTTSGGDRMYVIHSIARDRIRSTTAREKWKALIHHAARFRESYAREHGIIWHMLYAHVLYIEAMDFESAAKVAGFLTPTLLGWGQTDLAYELNTMTAESAEGPALARAIYTLGLIELGRSQYESAMARLNESMGMFESLGDGAGRSDALVLMGTIHANRSNPGEAIGLFEEALRIKEALGDSDGMSKVLGRLGQAYKDAGREEQALDVLGRSAETASSSGNQDQELLALEKLGGMHAARGELEKAIAAYERELQMLIAQKEPHALTRAFNRLGGLYFRKGDGTRALELLQKSLKYSEVTRNRELSAINLLEMSRVYVEARDYRAAIRHAALSLALFEAGSSESKSAALEVMAHIEREMGPEEFGRLNNQIMNELHEKEK